MSTGGSKAVRGATEKLYRTRRRRRRIAITVLGLIAIAIGLVATWFLWFRDSSVVAIEQIEVVGLEELGGSSEAEEIEEVVRTGVGRMTTLNASDGDLKEDLLPYARVADVRIRPDFPSSATVEVTVRRDGSVLGEGSQALLIADDGTILGPAEGLEDELPTLEGERPVSGATRLRGRDLSEALVLGALPAELRPFVTGADSDEVERGVEVEMTNGLTLIFGDDSRAAEKWKAAASVMADPELSGATSIDLSYPDRPAVTFSEPG